MAISHKTRFRQLDAFIVCPTLDYLELRSEAARRLLLGTIAHESRGQAIDQILGSNDRTLGPAYGLYQIEPATHDDLYRNFLRYRSGLKSKVEMLRAPNPSPQTQLATNLYYATAIARMIYFRRPEALPDAEDIEELAHYWKTFYNTYAGKGRVEDWVKSYDKYVAPIL